MKSDLSNLCASALWGLQRKKETENQHSVAIDFIAFAERLPLHSRPVKRIKSNLIHGVWRERCRRLQSRFIWRISRRTYQHWKWVLMNLEQNEINVKVNVKTCAYGSSWLLEGQSRSPLQLLAPGINSGLPESGVDAGPKDSCGKTKVPCRAYTNVLRVRTSPPRSSAFPFSVPFDSLLHQPKISASPSFCPQKEPPQSQLVFSPTPSKANLMCTSL